MWMRWLSGRWMPYARVFISIKEFLFSPVRIRNLIEFKGRNLEEKYHEQFRSYYHNTTPSTLLETELVRRKLCPWMKSSDYPSFLSSEYYNDFLLPQEIYHKTVVYLKSRNRLCPASLRFLNPRMSPGFLREEIALATVRGTLYSIFS